MIDETKNTVETRSDGDGHDVDGKFMIGNRDGVGNSGGGRLPSLKKNLSDELREFLKGLFTKADLQKFHDAVMERVGDPKTTLVGLVQLGKLIAELIDRSSQREVNDRLDRIEQAITEPLERVA